MAAVGVLEANITRTWIRWATGHHITKTGEQAVPNRMRTASVGTALRFAFHVRTRTYISTHVCMYVCTYRTWSYVCMCVWWMRVPTAQSLWAPMGEEQRASSGQRPPGHAHAHAHALARALALALARRTTSHGTGAAGRLRRQKYTFGGRSSFGEAVRPMEQDMRSGVGRWTGASSSGQGGGKWAAGRSLSGCRRFRPRAEPKYMRLST